MIRVKKIALPKIISIGAANRFCRIAASILILGITGCTTVPLETSSSLSSYDGLGDQTGSLTKSRLRVDGPAVLAARTIQIVPTSVSEMVGRSKAKSEDLTLVANAIDRAMCVGFSNRFIVVPAGNPSDLVVHATITSVVPTNKTVAGLSTALTLGSSAVLPVSVPRLPIGLGGLSIEAEAISSVDGKQQAAILWSRGANMITNKGRVSEVGDAYSLASVFGQDFSRMLVKGEDTIGGLPSLPSTQDLRSRLGGKSKYAACEVFGRAPGIKGFASGQLGLPPEWSDSGRKTAR